MNAIAQTISTFSSTRIIAMAVVGVVLLAVLGMLSMRLSNPVLTPLYTNLTSEDSAGIARNLASLGTTFEVSDDATQILVEGSEVLRLRMILAEKGLPNQGSVVGYEIFDNSDGMGTSNFVHNVNLIRALEGELSRTISSISSVRSVRVHLVMPKREVFQRNAIEPTASVALSVSKSNGLSGSEIEAIRHLVSSAVPGLSPKRVTIVDNKGNLLSSGNNDDTMGSVSGSATTDKLRMQHEEELKERINEMLSRALGNGRVVTQISAEMSFDRISTSTESYDPESQVARSVQTTEERSTSSDGRDGAVTAANNLPAADGSSGSLVSSSENERINEITNYEITKTVTNHIKDIGKIDRISVAVLVDGTYTKNEDGESVYEPRDEEQMELLETLVKTAIGFDEARGDTVEIVNMQFLRSDEGLPEQEDGIMDWLKRDLTSIIKTLVIGIVAVLAILMVIRPLVNSAFEIAPLEEEEEAEMDDDTIVKQANFQVPDEGDIDISELQTNIDSMPTKRLNELIDANTDNSINVIRQWVHQGSRRG